MKVVAFVVGAGLLVFVGVVAAIAWASYKTVRDFPDGSFE